VVEAVPEVVAEIAEPVVEAAPEVVAEVAEPVVEATPQVEPVAPVVNGTSHNGTAHIGASSNGTSSNGTYQNGTSHNGTHQNGTSYPPAPVAEPEPQLVAHAVAAPASAMNGAAFDEELKSALWAAATMVSDSAAARPVSAASFLPPPPTSTVQLAKPESVAPVATAAQLPIAVAPAPAPVVSAPEPAVDPRLLPGFMATVQKAPDSLQWFVFGGTAAFLGVIWVAIWLVVGK
jgi:hypothetical protein